MSFRPPEFLTTEIRSVYTINLGYTREFSNVFNIKNVIFWEIKYNWYNYKYLTLYLFNFSDVDLWKDRKLRLFISHFVKNLIKNVRSIKKQVLSGLKILIYL